MNRLYVMLMAALLFVLMLPVNGQEPITIRHATILPDNAQRLEERIVPSVFSPMPTPARLGVVFYQTTQQTGVREQKLLGSLGAEWQKTRVREIVGLGVPGVGVSPVEFAPWSEALDLTAFHGEVSVKTAVLDTITDPFANQIPQLLTTLKPNGTEQLVLLLIAPDALHGSTPADIVTALRKTLPPAVTIVGILGTPAYNSKPVPKGVVAVAFSGFAEISMGSIGPYQQLGQPVRATVKNGELVQMDGKPAVEVYAQALNASPRAMSYLHVLRECPLGVKGNAGWEPVAVSPMTGEGHFRTDPPIPDGAMVVILKRDYSLIPGLTTALVKQDMPAAANGPSWSLVIGSSLFKFWHEQLRSARALQLEYDAARTAAGVDGAVSYLYPEDAFMVGTDGTLHSARLELLSVQLCAKAAPTPAKPKPPVKPLLPITEARQAGMTHGFELDGMTIDFAWVPPGEFQMGSPENEEDRLSNEGPRHRVTINRGFWLAQRELTAAQWANVMGKDPRSWPLFGDAAPAESVSWFECQEFISKLNGRLKGVAVRLPTEAEWEYACRSGSITRFPNGDTPADADKQIIYRSNGGMGAPWPTSTKLPNAWSLFDMPGNVWEWCQDDWHADFTGAPVNGSAWTANDPRACKVIRGGSTASLLWNCRSASRAYAEPWQRLDNLGLRLVLEEVKE